jgi:predicted aspartyl protease
MKIFSWGQRVWGGGSILTTVVEIKKEAPGFRVTFWAQAIAMFLLGIVSHYVPLQAAPSTQKAPVTIPIQVAGNLVYMPGRVNDSRQFSVVLDTGSSISIVAPSIAQQVGLHASGSTQAEGLGHGSNETVQFVKGARLEWGEGASRLKIEDQQVAILPIAYIAEEVGRSTDALFGSNVFEKFRVTVDYQHEHATFTSPDAALGEAGESIPIKVSGGTPFVTATLLGDNGSRVSGRFLLDSGTTGALILNKQFLAAHPEIAANHHSLEVPFVKAVGGRIDTKLVRVAELDLGSFHFHQPIAVIPQSNLGLFAHAELAGIIGAGIFSRFTVTWEYGQGRMLLIPTSHLHDMFEADASGLRLTVTPPDYDTIHVTAVLAGSPAATAGLRVGDVVSAFNETKDLPLWRVIDQLRKPGTSPVLSILRGNQQLTVTLHLRRLV